MIYWDYDIVYLESYSAPKVNITGQLQAVELHDAGNGLEAIMEVVNLIEIYTCIRKICKH